MRVLKHGRSFAVVTTLLVILVLALGQLVVHAGEAREHGPVLTLRAVAVGPGEVDLSWSPSSATAVYLLRRNGGLVQRIVHPELGGYVDTTAKPGMTYAYSVVMVTSGRSISATSNDAAVRTPPIPRSPDVMPPSAPESLEATTYSNGIALSWGDATDDSAVTAYRLWREGVPIATLDPATLGFVDHAAPEGRTLDYAIRALDASGNISPPSIVAVSPNSNPGTAPADLEPEVTSSILTGTAVVGYVSALKRYPYLTDLVADHVTVNWGTDRSSTTGSVRWGSVAIDGSCNPTNVVNATRIAISVNLVAEYQWKAGLILEADKTYCYRVSLAAVDLLGSAASPRFTTQLAPGSRSPFTFAVLGDWGRAPASSTNQDLSNVMARLSESNARFALSVGDNAYESGGQANYGDLYQRGPNISAVFGPDYWAKVGASLPLFTAVGNHGFARSESNLPDLVNWPQDRAVSLSAGTYQKQTYCCLNGTSSGSYPSAWYAFDAGTTRIYVLTAAWTDGNNGTATPYQNDYSYHWMTSSSEYKWLENDLITHPSALKFAVFHYPIHSDNTSETSDAYLQGPTSLEGLLGRYGVDIAFNGHAHIYQRNRPNPDGLVTYVTGGGGAKLSSVRACSGVDAYGIGWSYNDNAGTACGLAPRPASVDHVYHYLLVSVSGTMVTVTPVDELGRAFDVQTYDFARPSDTQPPSPPANLTATARSSTQIDLAWTSSKDDVGVTGYDIYRNDTLLRTVGVMTAYSDTATVGGETYVYKVRARDLAGNLSTFSSEAAATTPPSVTATYVAVADAYVDQAIPLENFGTLSRTYADLSPNREAYLKFTVTGLTGEIEKATLRLYVGDGSARGPYVSLANNEWIENAITWSSRPILIGSQLADTGIVSSGAWLDIDVTSALSTNADYTFALIATSSDGVSVYSRESTTPSLRPQLVITVRSP